MTLKELLDIAKMNLFQLTTVVTPDFRLEQAEYKEGEKLWDIVVSFLVENVNKRSTTLMFPEFQFHRIYKRVKIKEDGTVVGFYIYNNKE